MRNISTARNSGANLIDVYRNIADHGIERVQLRSQIVISRLPRKFNIVMNEFILPY